MYKIINFNNYDAKIIDYHDGKIIRKGYKFEGKEVVMLNAYDSSFKIKIESQKNDNIKGLVSEVISAIGVGFENVANRKFPDLKEGEKVELINISKTMK